MSHKNEIYIISLLNWCYRVISLLLKSHKVRGDSSSGQKRKWWNSLFVCTSRLLVFVEFYLYFDSIILSWTKAPACYAYHRDWNIFVCNSFYISQFKFKIRQETFIMYDLLNNITIGYIIIITPSEHTRHTRSFTMLSSAHCLITLSLE